MSKVIAVGFRICFDLPPPKKKHHAIYLCRGFGKLKIFHGISWYSKGQSSGSFRRVGYVVKMTKAKAAALGEFCAWEDEEVWCSLVFPCNNLDISSRSIQICSTLYLGVEVSLKMKHEEKMHHV